MTGYLAAAAAALPFQIALGAVNTRRHLLTRGEMRFWCVVIFLLAQITYLGAGR